MMTRLNVQILVNCGASSLPVVQLLRYYWWMAGTLAVDKESRRLRTLSEVGWQDDQHQDI